jgi:Mg-chelatase subunit ChlD
LFAADKARVVIVAIDDSGSMAQSDPSGIRLEATAMVGLSAAKTDEFGIVRFGSSPSWALPVGVTPSPEALYSALKNFHSSDRWTNFADVLRLIDSYLDSQNPRFKDYDVNVILMTDGKPEPGPQYVGGPDHNREESNQIVQSLSRRGARLFSIGLGKDVQSDFLTSLAESANGFYSPARSPEELRLAFLKTVTRIYSLPAYQVIDHTAEASVSIGGNPDLVRAYLFRESGATELDTPNLPFLSSEHIAAYDLPRSSVANVKLKGTETGSSVVICARQLLSFVNEAPLPSTLLANSTANVRVKLMGGNLQLWERMFMKDSTVRIHLRSADGRDRMTPLYPDAGTRTYFGSLPTSEIGDYQASVELESPYGAVSSFLIKLNIASSAVDLPRQVDVEYPSFLPPSCYRLFGTKVMVAASLPLGTTTLNFTPPDGVRLSAERLEVAPNKRGTIYVLAAENKPAGLRSVPYTVNWNNGLERVSQAGILDVRLVPQNPWQFASRHWIVLLLVATVILICLVKLPAPQLRGVLVVEQQNAQKKKIVLDKLKSKHVSVVESRAREALESNPILIKSESDRSLFVLRMERQGGRWAPRVSAAEGVSLRSPEALTSGAKIHIRDSGLTFTYYPGN